MDGNAEGHLVSLQEQRLSWEKHSFTLRTQPDESLSVADEEPFDITGGTEDRLALCKPPKVRQTYQPAQAVFTGLKCQVLAAGALRSKENFPDLQRRQSAKSQQRGAYADKPRHASTTSQRV